MAGMTADLNWNGIVIPQGYVEIHQVSGGPNTTDGWTAYLYYYKSLADRQEDVNRKIPLDDPAYTMMNLPYGGLTDQPYTMFMDLLAKIFPTGTPVL